MQAALFEVACDVLVPGARPDAIHAGNVGSINTKLITPAANIPYAPDTTAILEQRGIVALPDFVSNAGGVLAGLVEMQGGESMRPSPRCGSALPTLQSWC